MKIEISSYGSKYTAETDHDDVALDKCMDIFEGLLTLAGFHRNTIMFGFRDKADEMMGALPDDINVYTNEDL